MSESMVYEMDERERCLEALGAAPEQMAELLGYCDNPYSELELPQGFPPLAPEPQVEFWRRYAEEAASAGAAAALSRRLPQLRFPAASGMSQAPEYRAATRRGDYDHLEARVGGPLAAGRDALELRLHESPAGPVPVLIARRRQDFVYLVQALTCRNEPELVPESMGACLIKGLADWERVAAYRQAWETRRGGPASSADWAEEMGNLPRHKELWQDRLILVSTGPYSAVPAAELGLEEGTWRERSVALRLAHECFHYLTLRLAGRIRSNLLDELIADYAGLVEAFGEYREDLARRFLGVDRLPTLRSGCRLEVYRGEPALSDGALEVVARLAAEATRRLAALPPSLEERGDPAAMAARLVALVRQPLERFATEALGAGFAAQRALLGRTATHEERP